MITDRLYRYVCIYIPMYSYMYVNMYVPIFLHTIAKYWYMCVCPFESVAPFPLLEAHNGQIVHYGYPWVMRRKSILYRSHLPQRSSGQISELRTGKIG